MWNVAAGRGLRLFADQCLDSITAILVSRFLLALQEANRAVVRVNPDDPLHSSRDPYDSMPSFISSLGAFINPDLPAPRGEDLDMDEVGPRSVEDCDPQASESQVVATASNFQLSDTV